MTELSSIEQNILNSIAHERPSEEKLRADFDKYILSSLDPKTIKAEDIYDAISTQTRIKDYSFCLNLSFLILQELQNKKRVRPLFLPLESIVISYMYYKYNITSLNKGDAEEVFLKSAKGSQKFFDEILEPIIESISSQEELILYGKLVDIMDKTNEMLEKNDKKQYSSLYLVDIVKKMYDLTTKEEIELLNELRELKDESQPIGDYFI